MFFKCCVVLLGLALFSGTSLADCQKILVRHAIRYQNCRPKLVLSYACNGTCASYTGPIPNTPNQLEYRCSCCQDTGRRFVRVRLLCPDAESPKFVIVNFAIPFDCSCQACSFLGSVQAVSNSSITEGKRTTLDAVQNKTHF